MSLTEKQKAFRKQGIGGSVIFKSKKFNLEEISCGN